MSQAALLPINLPGPGASASVAGSARNVLSPAGQTGASVAGNASAGGDFRTALEGLLKQGYDQDTASKLAAWLVQGHGAVAGGLTSDTLLGQAAATPADGQSAADAGKFLPPFLLLNLSAQGPDGRPVNLAGLGQLGNRALAGGDAASVATALGARSAGLPSDLATALQQAGVELAARGGKGLDGEGAALWQKLLPAGRDSGQGGTHFNQALLARFAEEHSALLAAGAGQGGGSQAHGALAGLVAGAAHGIAPGLAVPLHGGAVTTPAGLIIPQPVQHPGWPQSLGERVQWMLGQHVQAAHIRLNPPELGPLEVRILIQHDQTSVQFNTHHGHVRDALEASLPRLRDMLGEQGVQLGSLDVNVSSHQFAGHTPQHGGTGQGAFAGFNPGVAGDDASGTVLTAETPLRQSGSGMLDVYA